MGPARRKYVLDANCFIDASRDPAHAAAFDQFCAQATPGLYLSAVVASELRAGGGRHRSVLERVVLAPYARRGRIVVPTAAAWEMLGITLAKLAERDGLVLAEVRRSFVLDILLAYSCRELGAVLVSGNTKDLVRIARIFAFEFATPYPTLR